MSFNIRTDAATPPPSVPPAPPPERQHVVKPGESIATIAGDNHTTPQALLDINPQVRDPALIRPGDTLDLPPPTVSREVSTTVDAVLTKDATPAQRDAANEQVQDYVDHVGGISDQGITPEALPAQAQRMLGEAGLPVIDSKVIASVDQALGPQASLAQRTDGYGTVQRYVEQVGGVGDAGIVADALPAKAAELLRADGVPVALRSEVITSVDGLLSPDATSADRQAAYATVQQYVDQVGGVGDAGIVADALPAKAAQLLAASGNTALRFDPQVMQTVDQVIAPGAFDGEKLKGYEAVQAYVDQVGGVNDQGITSEYLPVRAAELMRTQGIALNTQVVDNASAEQIVVASQGGATPAEQAKILGNGYAAATPAVQQQVLADPRTQTVLHAVAADAMQPLTQSPASFGNGSGDAVPALKAMQALDAATDGMPRNLAAAVLDASVPAMVAYRQTDSGGAIGQDGMAALLRVTDRVAGTPAGDAAIQRVASEAGFYDRNATYLHVAEGGSPAYSLALGNPQNEAVDGVQSFASGPVADSITAYTEHTAELNWLVANHGPSMTPDQLNAAISDYITAKGPEWSAKSDELKAAVADNGLKLKTQIEALQAAGGHEDTIQQLLDDPNNQFAIGQALGAHPDAATEQSLRTFSILAKSSDGGRKVLGMVADAHIKAQILPELQNYNPADAASVQRVDTALARLQTGQMADALGVDQAKLTSAVESLKSSLPARGATQADVDAAMGRLNGDLDRLGLAKDTGAGQLFRGVGLGLASVGFAYSLEKLGKDPSSALAWAKVSADTIGLSQKTAEIMFGRGAGGSVAEFGASKLAAGVAGGLGAAVDGAFAVRAFAQGDPASGAMYALAAGGGGLAAASSAGLVGAWGGPVGIGIAVVAAVGLGLISKVNDSNKYMTDTSKDFLAHAGLDADASRALVDQSGDGYSPVAMLAQYAQLKGYDLKNDPQQQAAFATWINGMSADQLDHVRDWIHHTADDFGGDVGKLGSDPTVVLEQGMVVSQYGGAMVMDTPDTVGEIDAMMQVYGATPLPAV